MPCRRHRLFAALAVVALALSGPAVADAGGALLRAGPDQQGALARERALLIHDAARGREHLIRELAFVGAEGPLGVLVPTPSRPEVAAVAAPPFSALRERFPIQPRARAVTPTPAGVELLEVGEVGRLRSFVLAASDAKALGEWLAENRFIRDPAREAWLAHYVDLGFYYVAIRFDPPKLESDYSKAAVVSETVRISFDTPIGYYPYFEPAAAQARELELWVVGTEPVVPVALRAGEQPAWVQPLRRGAVTRDARTGLEQALAAELVALLPSGPLQVQTYEDHRRSREGFGDVLFAFGDGRELTPELAAALAPLLGILDPALIPDEPGVRP